VVIGSMEVVKVKQIFRTVKVVIGSMDVVEEDSKLIFDFNEL